MRLLNGYVIECQEVITDTSGEVIELKCSYLPETLGGKNQMMVSSLMALSIGLMLIIALMLKLGFMIAYLMMKIQQMLIELKMF